MSKTTFFINIEYFRNLLSLSQETFCQNVGISNTAYDNYRRGSIPRPGTMNLIIPFLNKKIEENNSLKNKFPDGVDSQDLTNINYEEDYKQRSQTTQNKHFYYQKFVDRFICYYTSTNISGEKTIQYGIIQIVEEESITEFKTYGIFSLKNYQDALDIYHAINSSDKTLESYEKENNNKHILFKGISYLSATLFWFNLTNDEKTEHVSASFDLDEKILTKYPKERKDFLGARGIALSQTSGLGNKTISFPFVLTKGPLMVDINTLSKYLYFNYSQQINKNAVDNITTSIIELLNALSLIDSLSNETKSYLISSLIEQKNNDMLQKNVFPSHYYKIKEMNDFYKDIIGEPRKKQIK